MKRSYVDRVRRATRSRLLAAVALLVLSGGRGAAAQENTERAIGEQLAAQCATCHQIYVGSRARRASGVPEIRGMAPEELIRHLDDFRTLRRAHPIMSDIAENLSEAEIRALANYYGSLSAE